ncbi:MAG: DUF3891 family protein [Thermoanaerobaculia bacterium]
MLVIPQAERLRLVTQPDHAGLASELLALWRTGGFPKHPRRAELLVAVREHDNGWREADAAPRLDPRGGPLDFREAPDGLRREIWLRAVERLAADRPYAALLTAQHALTLHRDRNGREDWAETLGTLEASRSELLERTGLAAGELEEDYRWLFVADALSLALCGALDRVEEGGLRALRTADGLSLDPFPLAGATTFRLPCRHVPDRSYAGERDLASDLGAARWEEIPVRLTPLAPSPGGSP